MTDSAKQKTKQTTDPRIFTKKVGDTTLTRNVTSVSGEVAATFDGFTEQKASKAAGSSSSAGSTSGRSTTGTVGTSS